MTLKYRFKMLHISLFSGIGGFDLAAQWAGWTNIVSCEINPFGRRHLAYYWPDAYHHDDIQTLTIQKINEELTKRHGANWRTNDVVLTGGFPCQPYSLAGKRLGKEDERHLWPEMLRVIQEVKPTWIVGENVFGLINWSHGLVFDEVQTDLETAGYEVQAFVLPACAADAPHRRDRVWIVACRDGNGQQRSNGKHEVNASEGWQYAQRDTIEGAEYGFTANTNSTPPQCRNNKAEKERKKQRGRIKPFSQHSCWEEFPTESPVCARNDGLSAKLDGITFSKWRNESIKGAGNAIVPQIAYRIFETINQYNKQTEQ